MYTLLSEICKADLEPVLEGGVARGGQEDLSKGKPGLLDKASGKADKVKVLRSWLFRRSDTTVCRSSERLPEIPRNMKPVCSVRQVESKPLLAKPVRPMTRDSDSTWIVVLKIADYRSVRLST